MVVELYSITNGNNNTQKWNLGNTEALSGDSENRYNHVISKAPDIMSEG